MKTGSSFCSCFFAKTDAHYARCILPHHTLFTDKPFGRTPPDASVTVPTIVAVCPKAERDNPNRSAHRTTKGRRLRCFRLGDGLIALADEEEFMY